MAYNHALLGAMDTLCFHQMILFNQPVLLIAPNSVPEYVSESFTTTSYQSSNYTSTNAAEVEDSALSDDSPLTLQRSLDSELEERKKIVEEVLKKTRPSRLNKIKIRSYSSISPLSTTTKASINKGYSCSVVRLEKTMSCKSSGELEVEELKGFMDLGFRFDTQNLCPRMMSVVPGLQRLGGAHNTEILQKDITQISGDGNEKRLRSGGVTRRPYLSEAWLINLRPDSPLLNLRIPRNSGAADMKKHLKFWAVTVASVVQQSCY